MLQASVASSHPLTFPLLLIDQDLQQTVAGLRNGLSGMQALLDQDDWHAYLRAVLQHPLQQYKHVQSSSNAFMEVSTIGLPDRLIRQGSKALSKGKQAQVCFRLDCCCCPGTSAVLVPSEYDSARCVPCKPLCWLSCFTENIIACACRCALSQTYPGL